MHNVKSYGSYNNVWGQPVCAPLRVPPMCGLFFPPFYLVRFFLLYQSISWRCLFVQRYTDLPNIPYILESNPHTFYSFRGLKNQLRLDSRSWAGFWKNDRAAVRAVRTIQYNNLLFYLLFIIYIIFIIYYSSDSPSSLITESVCLVGGWRKDAD